MRAPALFVMGTDTGVGKTRVAASLCRALAAELPRIGVFKPVETGCRPDPCDALLLQQASGCSAGLETVCPYRLRDPLAPAVAARREGVMIEPTVLQACLAALRETHDVVVCEGAGGLLVPLTDDLLSLDWVAAIGAPVLLVGRLGLGTINHTLLAARCLRERGVPLLGTVLSDTGPGGGLAEATNPEVLSRFPEVGFLGVVPHAVAPILPEAALAAVRRFLHNQRTEGQG